MSNQTLRLHGFAQSGNTYKVALLLRALGLPHENVFVDFFKGVARDPAWRASVNPMGEAPVLEVDGRQLTQSGAILTWLADQHGRFGGANADERYEVLRWILFDNHKFTSYLATWRFCHCFAPKPTDAATMAFLMGRVRAAYAIVEDHLATRPWMVGEGATIADFSLAGYVFYPAEETGLDLPTDYPAIAAWRERVRALPGWGDPYAILPGERIAPRHV